MRPPTWYWRLWWRIGYSGPYQVGWAVGNWYVWRFNGVLAGTRWLWWRWVRRYRYEVCFDCGRPVSRCTPTWWHASDELWELVVGGPGGVLCAACFTHRCRALGVTVSWQPVVEWTRYHEFRAATDPPPFGLGLDDWTLEPSSPTLRP